MLSINLRSTVSMIYHVIVDFLLIKAMAASALSSLLSFSVELMVKGHHIYKDYQWERHNYHNSFAVSMMKGSVIIGYVPRQFC